MLTADREAWRPRASAGVAVVDCEDGAVLVAPSGQLVEIDLHARLLWSLFDGSATLSDLADDVVAVFEGAERDAVVADLAGLVGGLRNCGMVVDSRQAPPITGPVDRLDAPATCCGNRLGEETWRSTIGCRVGGRLIGVRTQDDRLDRATRELLASVLVEGEDAPPNLSVVWRAPDAAGEEPRLEVYSQLRLVAASTSATQARRFLEAELTALADLEPDRLWFSGVVVGGEQGVVLLPRSYQASLAFLAPMLGRRGFTIGPSRVALDVDAGEVVVAAPLEDRSGGSTASFDGLATGDSSWPAPLASGRHPLRAIGGGPMPRPGDHGTRAAVTDYLRSMVGWVCLDRSTDFQRTVDQLIAIEDRVDRTGPDPAAVVDWVSAQVG